jgi:14-3-3 protein beta/theta/zeta
MDEKSEHYEDMVNAMKNMAMSKKVELTVEERDLFSKAYKNLIGHHRSAWQSASKVANAITKQQLKKIEKEIRDICNEVLTLVDKVLIPNANTTDGRIFFKKMKGDYYRYLAEVAAGDERQKMIKESQRFYDEAFDNAKKSLSPTSPVRLDVALNFSIFYYEILNAPGRACCLAKQAFDDAIEKLDTLDDENYKDSMLMIQFLRDNIMRWTTDDSDGN